MIMVNNNISSYRSNSATYNLVISKQFRYRIRFYFLNYYGIFRVRVFYIFCLIVGKLYLPWNNPSIIYVRNIQNINFVEHIIIVVIIIMNECQKPIKFGCYVFKRFILDRDEEVRIFLLAHLIYNNIPNANAN